MNKILSDNYNIYKKNYYCVQNELVENKIHRDTNENE